MEDIGDMCDIAAHGKGWGVRQSETVYLIVSKLDQ